MKRLIAFILVTFLFTLLYAAKVQAQESHESDFIYSVRAYNGGGYDSFQIAALKDLGINHAHGVVFSWSLVEPRRGDFKWEFFDNLFQLYEANEEKIIPVLMLEKCGLEWLPRESPEVSERYEEYAYQVVNRYHHSPSWAGMVSVFGNSSDCYGNVPLNYPEPVVSNINAAYDGIKRADPATIVIAFNMGTEGGTAWEEWHRQAFALSPKFDWFGMDSYGGFPTQTEGFSPYVGVLGVNEVRKFLDDNGYSDKPIFNTEYGYLIGEDIGGQTEELHAEVVIETLLMARTLSANLKGWVYFNLFQKSRGDEDYGLMTSLDQSNPPTGRKAYYALKTLLRVVKFNDYQYHSMPVGEYNQRDPFVYKFNHDSENNLWVIFSPWIDTYDKSCGPSILEPVNQTVCINIAPATRGALIDMVGNTSMLYADVDGNVFITSTRSPVYLKTWAEIPECDEIPVILPKKNDVDIMKVWTVKFNKEIDLSTAICPNIRVVDAGDNEVDIKVAAGNDGKSAFVYPPDGGYKTNGNYFLRISKNIRSATKKNLTKPVIMEFSTR